MSSSDYFDDDIDEGILNELDVLESTQPQPLLKSSIASSSKASPITLKHATTNASINVPPPPQRTTTIESDDYDITFDYDENELLKLDGLMESAHRGNATAGPSVTLGRSPSKGGVQTTLFGDILTPANNKTRTSPNSKGGGSSKGTLQHSKSAGQVFRKTKVWDHTAFSKTGRRKKDNGKSRMDGEDDMGEEGEEQIEFEQFPAPFVPGESPPPMKLKPDLLATKQWIFPLNRPKRDYQFNISKHCLFENTLVALPTGLGKTFIAGVVMLNFYRWFPDGKIVFVAPTKPLVAQQIDACHQTCGIPGRDAVELTGNVPRAQRSKAWVEKRVFYMTPQTLYNDLVSDNCDPRDIVLFVIDEAHKGSGDYAYATVVRFLMAKNPHFRVLALTATPGSKPEAVQAIVDALHISRIEIRDEQSWDIRGYINHKKVEQHIIAMPEDIAKVRDLLAKVMKPWLQRLAQVGVMRGNMDPVLFHPFRAQAAMGEIHGRRDGRQLAWAFPLLKKLGALGRAMGYLLEASQTLAYRSLKEAVEGDKNSDKAKSSNNKLMNDANFQAVMRELELQASIGFTTHPKKEKLKMLVLNHFGTRMPDQNPSAVESEGGESGDNTRVMVFVSFREAVEELVEFLNQESPIIRATKFIGQGTDKAGKKGFAQKEQLDVIKRFKKGDYNVLVSTSIGEEGLDIGEIDMIVCYESQKTPIRMLQRVGRTGRKRDGFVHVLLAEHREELNWMKAQENYAEVQHTIVRGDQLEFYADVERLIPNHIKPEALEMQMEIEPYDREALQASERKSRTSSANALGSGKKRKRNDDVGRNIPDGASRGFVSVADLLMRSGGKKRKAISAAELEAGGEDSTDDEIEAGPLAARRTKSTPAESELRPKGKGKEKLGAKRTKSAGSKKAKKTAKKTLSTVPLSQANAEDEDDFAIEHGFRLGGPGSGDKPSKRKQSKSTNSSPDSRSLSLSSDEEPLAGRDSSPELPLALRDSSPGIPLADQEAIIDICTPSEPGSSRALRSPSPPPKPAPRQTTSRTKSAPSRMCASKTPVGWPGSPSHNASRDGPGDDSLAWLLASSDDDERVNIDAQTHTSPRQLGSQSLRRTSSSSSEIEFVDDPPPLKLGFVRSTTLLVKDQRRLSSPRSINLSGSDVEIESHHPPAASKTRAGSSDSSKSKHSSSSIFKYARRSHSDTPLSPPQNAQDNAVPPDVDSPTSSLASILSHTAPDKKRKRPASVEPSSPLGAPSSPDELDDQPLPSQPVRPPGGRKKRTALDNVPASPLARSPPLSQIRPRRPPPPLAVRESDDSPEMTQPVRAAGARKKRIINHNPLSSPEVAPPVSQKRLRRLQDSPPAGLMGPPPIPANFKTPKRSETKMKSKPKKHKFKDAAEAAQANPWIDLEASHSGDDVSGGGYSDDDFDGFGRSSEDGHGFIAHDDSSTQASPSYDQFAVYRQSLFSQVPAGPSSGRLAPVFGNRPKPRGITLGVGSSAAGSSRRRGRVSYDSPRRSDEEPDEYAFGSFIVDDDAEISYVASSES